MFKLLLKFLTITVLTTKFVKITIMMISLGRSMRTINQADK